MGPNAFGVFVLLRPAGITRHGLGTLASEKDTRTTTWGCGGAGQPFAEHPWPRCALQALCVASVSLAVSSAEERNGLGWRGRESPGRRRGALLWARSCALSSATPELSSGHGRGEGFRSVASRFSMAPAGVRHLRLRQNFCLVTSVALRSSWCRPMCVILSYVRTFAYLRPGRRFRSKVFHGAGRVGGDGGGSLAHGPKICPGIPVHY